MTNPKWEEEIIVVPRKSLFGTDNEFWFQGTQSQPNYTEQFFDALESDWSVMRRGSLEDDTPKENNAEINRDFKQPIPYVLITRGNEIFAYERLKGGGESRLHGKISLGVGGHMNPIEGADSFNNMLMENVMRELNEEVNMVLPLDGSVSNYSLKTIGFLNDDENEVGKVHIALLMRVDLPENSQVTVRETDQLKGFWTTAEDLWEDQDKWLRLESWSQIAVEALLGNKN